MFVVICFNYLSLLFWCVDWFLRIYPHYLVLSLRNSKLHLWDLSLSNTLTLPQNTLA